jgi:hypothetical protein
MIDPQKLHLFVDGELTDSERKQIENALNSCEKSRAEVESIRNLKTALTMKAEPITCDATWAACKSRLDAIDRVEKSGNFITRFSWAFVTGVAAIIIVGGTLTRNAQRDTVSSDMIAGIVSSSKKPILGGYNQALLDQRLKEADLNLSRLRLLGSRTTVLDGHEVIELALSDSDGPMTMLVVNGIINFENMEKSQDGRFMLGQISNTQNCVTWKARNKSFVLIAPRSHGDLTRTILNNAR